MKLLFPLAACLLLWPLAAGAQGYSGVMPPQQGFRAPPAAAATAPNYNGPGGHLDSPYSGTGASDNTGYASVTGGADSGDAQADGEVAPESLAGDEDAAPPPTSAFASSFAPKEVAEDNATAGNSIYDTVNANAGTPAERKRKALARKIEAAQKKAQREVDRANEERARQTRAMVQGTLDEQRRKREGEDEDAAADTGESDDQMEKTQEQLDDEKMDWRNR